jgi:hypothetical protein
LVILMARYLQRARPSQAEDVMPIEFGTFAIGALPTGFSTGLTGRGKAVAWTVIENPSAPSGRVLAEISADRTDYRFPLAIYDDQGLTNVAVAVHFKPVAGKVDRAAGIAVRLLDRTITTSSGRTPLKTTSGSIASSKAIGIRSRAHR